MHWEKLLLKKNVLFFVFYLSLPIELLCNYVYPHLDFAKCVNLYTLQ